MRRLNTQLKKMEAEYIFADIMRWGIAGDAKDAKEIERLMWAMDEGWKIYTEDNYSAIVPGQFLITPALRYHEMKRKKDDKIKMQQDQLHEAECNETLSAKLDKLDLTQIESALIKHQEEFFKGLRVVPKESKDVESS